MSKPIKKWVDLSSLPTKIYKGRTVINWELVKNHEVPFLYGEIKGKFTIIHHFKKNKHIVLKIKYKDREFTKYLNSIRQAKISFVVDSYHYSCGDIVNNSKILEKIKMRHNKNSFENGYLLKCLETGQYYEMRQTHIKQGRKSPFVSGQKVYEGNWLYSETHLHKYFENPEEAKLYTRKSGEKINCICPNCKKPKQSIVCEIVNRGFSCNYCSTNTSYSEKLLSSLLDINKINYIPQKSFKENRFKYDFYLPEYNFIIETHGIQHYEESTGYFKDSLTEIQENDLLKKEFCESKKLSYIEIDCRKSEMKFILDNINKNTYLRDLFKNQDLEELSILIQKKSNHKNILTMVDDRRNGMTYKQIGTKHGYSEHTIANILKRYIA
ncbi:helix-turn-helix domain-containing protein [Corticicoccus populi]|uniref:Helix-turn-helix domain-containing protein n=1 Tax=Corticicoccus populi TaxID=1812821 RepID=A0ABW5WRU1_9STAP